MLIELLILYLHGHCMVVTPKTTLQKIKFKKYADRFYLLTLKCDDYVMVDRRKTNGNKKIKKIKTKKR